MTKKFGGIIKNWQVHNLDITKKILKKAFPKQKAKPMVISGTIVDDPLGRWKIGYHMKTSLVVKLDREKGEVETLNTVYKLTGKEGADVLPDLGNAIANVFY